MLKQLQQNIALTDYLGNHQFKDFKKMQQCMVK